MCDVQFQNKYLYVAFQYLSKNGSFKSWDFSSLIKMVVYCFRWKFYFFFLLWILIWIISLSLFNFYDKKATFRFHHVQSTHAQNYLWGLFSEKILSVLWFFLKMQFFFQVPVNLDTLIVMIIHSWCSVIHLWPMIRHHDSSLAKTLILTVMWDKCDYIR